jgi:hypothetical protein
MKIVITGHTSGIGKYLYNYFSKDNEVIGISRTTGYNLETDIDKIIEQSKNADLFINNSSVNDCQIKLLESLHNEVKKMIVIGSIAGEYDQLIQSEYSRNKKELEKRSKEISLIPNSNILYLKISMLEDAISSDVLISFEEVLNVIKFWLDNPKLSRIDFEFKLTPFTLEKVKEKFNASQQAIDSVLNNMCQNNKKYF